ncbi:MAG TPA: exosortase A [Steroidobacteraceae bacterium]|nr:exosortase A [Steroidobacteraceae bacterium]
MSTTATAVHATSAGGRLLRSPLLPVVVAWLAAVFLLWDTFADMWRAWGASGTFTHGYAVFPIALFLLWFHRERWLALALRSSFLGVALVGGCVTLWLAGSLLHLNVVMQLGAVGVLVCSVIAVAGIEVFRAAMFPLLFMFFAVPVGEELVPWLMDFTARFTVAALDAVGIPVYAEGHLIYIPTGTFSVEKACSGIRYLFASIVLGTLYAHIFYSSTWRRILFVAMCAVVPVLANGLRAFLIVILAHVSENEIAIGVDHLIYGWVFFGFVMLLVFWLGRAFAEPATRAPALAPGSSPDVAGSRWLTPWVALIALLAPLLGLRVADAALQGRETVDASPSGTAARVPAPLPGWTGPITMSSEWEPHFIGPTRVVTAAYLHGPTPVDVAFLSYAREHGGAELVNSENLLFDDEQWTWLSERSFQVELPDGQQVPVFAVQVRHNLARRAIWRIFLVGERAVSGGLRAKLARAQAILRGENEVGTALVISAQQSGQGAAPEREVRAFLLNYYPQLLSCLREQAAASAGCVPAP